MSTCVSYISSVSRIGPNFIPMIITMEVIINFPRNTSTLRACLLAVFLACRCTCQYRGGTISWSPTGMDYEVKFRIQIGWEPPSDDRCNAAQLGTYKHSTQAINGTISCIRDCVPDTISADLSGFYCASYSSTERWEQRQKVVRHNFIHAGVYMFSYTGRSMLPLERVTEDRWNLQTIVDLRTRSDTGKPNESPVTTAAPIYMLPFGCPSSINIPMFDKDGDKMKCRWARGDECLGVCNGLPHSALDKTSCVLTVEAYKEKGYKDGGMYAVTLMVEDFAKSPVLVGSSPFDATDPLSSIPVQFLIKIESYTNGCEKNPSIVDPSPKDMSDIVVYSGKRMAIKLYFTNTMDRSSHMKEIILSPPYGLTHSSIYKDTSLGLQYSVLSWLPESSQYGYNPLCAQVVDDKSRRSKAWCVNLVAGATDFCHSYPCVNGGNCSNKIDAFSCRCIAGYSGQICETDIDECAGNPCQNGGTCVDLVDDFLCRCSLEYEGSRCQSERTMCIPNPCLNGGVCKSGKYGYECSCPSGYLGLNCEIKSTDPDQCAKNEGSFCRCVVNREQAVIHFPHQLHDNDLIYNVLYAALSGLSTGIFLGIVCMSVYCCCCKRRSSTLKKEMTLHNKDKCSTSRPDHSTRPSQRKMTAVPAATNQPNSHSSSPETNTYSIEVYRAAYVDKLSRKTSPVRHPVSLMDSSPDW